MFSIDMGGCDIVLGVEWLHTLGPIIMDFKDLTMQFQHEGQKYKFQGITTRSHEIISSHRMEKPLKEVHSCNISHLHSIQVVETPSMHFDLQYILSQQKVVFNTPHGLPPSCDIHDHFYSSSTEQSPS
jgi:hypothetical protein